MITASLSTIAWRSPGLATAVASVLPQVDWLNVFLQGYGETPECLRNDKVSIVRDISAPESARLGASAKYHWLWHGLVAEGYHFSIDDDIEYPPDYISYCIRKIEQYGRKAIVGFHGAIYNEQMRSYFRDRQTFNHGAACDADRFVHILGTGTTAMHTSTLRLTRADFTEPNSCDLFLGIAAQRQRVPMLCLARPAGYLKPLPLAAEPRAASGPESYATRMVELHRTIPEWHIHTAQPAEVKRDQVVVVVPCYNEQDERIRRTVASALATPGVDLVRIVDDGSDVPVSLPQRDRIEVMRRPVNGGPSAALNAGIRSLPDDAIICRLDVGDEFYPLPKARQIEMVKAGAPAVCSWRFDPISGEVKQIESGWERGIFKRCQFSSTAAVFRKSAWSEAGEFNETLRWSDDWRFAAALQAYVGWTEFPEATGSHGEFPGGHSDVRGDSDRLRRRRADRARASAMCRVLGNPGKHAHLFHPEWCAKRGLVPMRWPK